MVLPLASFNCFYDSMNFNNIDLLVQEICNKLAPYLV